MRLKDNRMLDFSYFFLEKEEALEPNPIKSGVYFNFSLYYCQFVCVNIEVCEWMTKRMKLINKLINV